MREIEPLNAVFVPLQASLGLHDNKKRAGPVGEGLIPRVEEGPRGAGGEREVGPHSI